MRIIYAREPFDHVGAYSLFLAGPTPRSHDILSWRKEALEILSEYDLDLTVFIPEDRNGIWDESVQFEEQVSWEDTALTLATCILFWIPRSLPDMPGFTTNVEFGRWMSSGKIVLGIPPSTPKSRYLLFYADKYRIPKDFTLEETIYLALVKIARSGISESDEMFPCGYIYC